MAYITTSDLTDNIINMFPSATISAKITLSTSAVNDLAERLGVRDSDDIETSPVHYQVKRYAEYWVYREICRDFIGTNNAELPEQEKYILKYKLYRQLVEEKEGEISKEMLTGDVEHIKDRANSITRTLFRG